MRSIPGWALGITIAAYGCLPSVQAAAMCHADILVKDVNFEDLTAAEKAQLGPELAKTLAVQNGMSQSDVMSPQPNAQAGTVGFFSGSFVAPWSPANRKPYTGGSSMIVSALISGCEQADMILGVLKNPAVHQSIENSISMTLANSGAISGAVTVLGVAVVPSKTALPQVQAAPAAGASPDSVPLAAMPDPAATQSNGWLVPSLVCLAVSVAVGASAHVLC